MDEVISILRSKLKREILRILLKENMTPLMIAKILKRPRASVSRVIIEMSKIGFVNCINDDADRWRKYEITKKGKEIIDKIKRFG